MRTDYSSYIKICMCVLALGLSGCGDNDQEADQTAQIEAQTAATQAIPAPANFICGQARVRITFNSPAADTLQMHVGEEIFNLTQVVSASGARYEAKDESSTIFWNKGNSALITVLGHELEECRLVEAAATETSAEAADKAALPALQNTTWVLRSMNGRTVIDNVTVTMAMDSEGRIGGRSGCNNYGAGYALDGGQIKITEQMAATMMACVPPAIAEQEAQYLDILHNVTSWKMVEPNGLVLTTPDNRVLAFTPEMAATSQK